jgi:glyoxylase-like metal-dependent hydrolase (beta-lactamase superfamily II)
MSLEAGQITELAAGVRRLLAPNPSMMTGPGTNTYLLGSKEIAVIDPGPAMPKHVDAIQELADAPIKWILVTHTHPDHSPAAALLAKATGAKQFGRMPPKGRHQDQTFKPDHMLADGGTFQTEEFSLQVIHTPGHASNHLCYLHSGHNLLLTGDHIINGSTVVIDPPDGSMGDYLRSLERLKEISMEAILPGHGEIMEQPQEAVDWLINHRLQREKKIIGVLRDQPDSTSRELVPRVYEDVDEKLHELAEHSLLAHLIRLEEELRASMENGRWRLTK